MPEPVERTQRRAKAVVLLLLAVLLGSASLAYGSVAIFGLMYSGVPPLVLVLIAVWLGLIGAVVIVKRSRRS